MPKFHMKTNVPLESKRYHCMFWLDCSCWFSRSSSSFMSSITLFRSIWSSFFCCRLWALSCLSYLRAIFQRYSTLFTGIFFFFFFCFSSFFKSDLRSSKWRFSRQQIQSRKVVSAGLWLRSYLLMLRRGLPFLSHLRGGWSSSEGSLLLDCCSIVGAFEIC